MLTIDLQSGLPIYKQIVEYFKQKIIEGELLEDEQLPSIRVLAAEIRTNPNTIKKAYLILEQEAYIYRVQGKGCFVKSLGNKQIGKIEDEIKGLLRKAVAKGDSIKLPKEHLLQIIDEIYDNKKE